MNPQFAYEKMQQTFQRAGQDGAICHLSKRAIQHPFMADLLSLSTECGGHQRTATKKRETKS